MKSVEILNLIYMILDMENCVWPVCQSVEEKSPMKTAMEVHNYLQGILNAEIGDPVWGSELVDMANYMSREELLNEIAEIKAF